MSFIRPRDFSLLEKSTDVRRELRGFLLSVTLWSAFVSLLANTLFVWLHFHLKDWAYYHPWKAALAILASLTLVGYLVLLAVVHTVTSAMGITRRLTILLPMMLQHNTLELTAIRGYHITASIRDRLGRQRPHDWDTLVAQAISKDPARPFGGEVYKVLAKAVGETLLAKVSGHCEFLLSPSSAYHGVDYRSLRPAKETCIPSGLVCAASGIFLPAKCRIETSTPEDGGKTAARIRISGPFGCLDFNLFAHWAILGPYHAFSLRLARSRLDSKIKSCSDHDINRQPSLWVAEIPVEIRVTVRNTRTPFFLFSARFEVFASWLCELLDLAQESASWEWFADREHLGQTIREALDEKLKVFAAEAPGS